MTSRYRTSRLLAATIGAALAALLAAGPSIQARQGTAAGGPKITQIRVIGGHRFTEEQVVAASGLRVGDPALESNLNDAASRLAGTGAFSDVTYQYRANAASWEAELQVTEAASFLPCMFDNFLWFSDADLGSAVHRDVPLFDGSLPAGQGGLKDEVVASLNRFLRANQIQASTLIMPAADKFGGKITRFVVRISDLPMPVLGVDVAGGPLDPAVLNEAARGIAGSGYSRHASTLLANTTLTETYQDAGYLQPKFSEPLPAFADPSGKDASQGVIVKFTVASGPRYTWAGVAWTDNQALAADQLTKLLQFSTGELARRSKLLAGWEAASDAFQRRGYLSVSITPTPRYNDGASSVHFDVQVAEGPQFVMGELRVDDPSEKVAQDLAAAWPLKKGQIYDVSLEKEFLRTGAGRVLAHDGAPRKSLGVQRDPHPDTRMVDVLLRTTK